MKKATNFFWFTIIALMVSVFTSCTEGSSIYGDDEEIISALAIPEYFVVTGDKIIDVVFDDKSTKAEKYEFTLEAQDTIKVAGKEAFSAKEELLKDVETSSVKFAYNYNKTNTLMVGGLTMKYTYNKKEYILECRTPLTVEGDREVVEENTDPSYYELSKTHYVLKGAGFELAKDTQVFVVEEGYVPPTFEKVEWDYNHVAYRRAATLANSVITVVCDNVANFADIYSDGSMQNEEHPQYTVNNTFNFNTSVIKVDDLNEVVGKSFNFNNGVVTVANVPVRVTWTSAKVMDKVMHNGKDYASEITACRAQARVITFNTATEATIVIYDNDASDYAEVVVPVSVEENRKLTETTRDFVHVAYRRVAQVVNKVISVICDNKADFVDKYSDNTEEPETVNYIVTNRFSLTMPEEMVVEKANSIVGNSYDFNAGTAVVNGYNVNVVFNNRVVADIMHNNKNYKDEAPVCEVVAKTITFTSSTTAVIRFEDKNNADDYSEAMVVVKITEAELITGKIIAGWMTDAYMRQIGAHDRTDLHILAENNGVYTVYSRLNKNEAWTVTNLSYAQGQAVINSGRALAWVWNGSAYELGTVNVIPREDEKDRFVLEYYTLSGDLAYRLGKANEAIGQPWRDAIRGTLKQDNNGMWTIKEGEVTYYFISSVK